MVEVNGNESVKNGKIGHIKRSKLKEKIFVQRESLLTELFDSWAVRSLYYMFIAIALTLFVNSMAYEYIYLNRLTLPSRLLSSHFGNILRVLHGWLCIFSLTLFVYPALHVWAMVHVEITKYKALKVSWNLFSVVSAVFYFAKSLQFSANFVSEWELSVGESTIVLAEQVRLLMKTYAFVRGNVPKATREGLRHWDELKLPKFEHFLYFLFVPTLVYRDVYPRTKQVNWTKVALYFAEFFGAILTLALLYDLSFQQTCEQFKSSRYDLWDIAWSVLKNSMAGFSVMMILFYLLLHVWLNAFAEMLRFADRQFYEDWWTSTTFEVYFRKWNVVVNDWLYVYIYKDLYETLPFTTKFVPKLAVFFISSIFHEYILTYSLRMFYPFLFVLYFGLGFLMMFVKSRETPFMKVLFIYGMSIGSTLGIMGYVIEGCVRRNFCASDEEFEWYHSRTFSSKCLVYN